MNFACSPQTPTASSKSSCLLTASVVDASLSEEIETRHHLTCPSPGVGEPFTIIFPSPQCLSQALFFSDVLGICSSWTIVEKGPRLKLWVRPCPRLLYVCCLPIDYGIASFYLKLVLEDIRLARGVVVRLQTERYVPVEPGRQIMCRSSAMSCGRATTSLMAEVGTVTNSKFSSTRSRDTAARAIVPLITTANRRGRETVSRSNLASTLQHR